MPFDVYDSPFDVFNFLNSRLIVPAKKDALAIIAGSSKDSQSDIHRRGDESVIKDCSYLPYPLFCDCAGICELPSLLNFVGVT